jgi:hypothetical protein
MLTVSNNGCTAGYVAKLTLSISALLRRNIEKHTVCESVSNIPYGGPENALFLRHSLPSNGWPSSAHTAIGALTAGANPKPSPRTTSSPLAKGEERPLTTSSQPVAHVTRQKVTGPRS